MLLDAIPCSVLLIDRDMRVVDANPHFLERARRSHADTVQQPLARVFPAVLFEQTNMASQIRQVFSENRPIKGERIAYRAPGIPFRIYYYSILPFCAGGAVENIMLLMEDVTERIRLSEEVRRMERNLASVVESASDIVLSTDLDAKVMTWNPAAEKATGLGMQHMKNQSFLECCPPDQHKEIKGILHDMGRRNRWRMVEFDLMTKMGTRFPVSWVFSPMKDDQDKTVGIVGVGRNITDHRKLEMQLHQSQKLASLGVMAGGIAHELRNPLAVCSSAAQFLMDDDISRDFLRECADKIHTGIKRASGIIENLMKLTRPVSEKEMTAVDIAFILRETLVLVSHQARVQKIKVKQKVPEAAVKISGMASLLQQVFMNLFLNAIEVMPDQGTLSVSLEKQDGEAVVRVADTGPGISKKHLDKIFDPFYTAGKVGKGVGLGLSICHAIVKEHGGTIEVDSAAGKGTSFTVKLPASPRA